METLISVDIECDGPIPGEYSMLSLGACVVGSGSPADQFYRELRPISEKFDPEALAVSGLDREKLARHGYAPMLAIVEFVKWVESFQDPVFCSFSSWDWGWVYWYLMKYVGKSPFGHSALDIKSYYAGKYGTDWRATTKGRIGSAQKHLFKGVGRNTHNALTDAINQAKLFENMRGDSQNATS